MEEARQNYSCFNCVHIVDDCEYGDYGSTHSVNFLCTQRNHIEENEKFPFEQAPKSCFRLDFWHSIFSDDLTGSRSNFNKAIAKYSEWFEKEYGKDEVIEK